MKRPWIAGAACLALFAGCNGSTVPVGQVAKLKPFKTSDLKTWVAADEPTIRLFSKPKPEFDALFDGLLTNKKIFREEQGARIRVLEKKDYGMPVVRGEILTGQNKGRELWIPEAEIEPDS